MRDDGRTERDDVMLTREDVGYGPARPYEYSGPEMEPPRERRERRDRGAAPAPPGQGPYHARLLRRHRPDRWIRAEIEETLFHDTWIDADRIRVDVNDGVATLTGTLATAGEVRAAVEDARGIGGVVRIRNRLEVEP